MRQQIYGYLPNHRTSLPRDWYQIMLLGDRGTCVWTTCLTAVRPGIQFVTSRVTSQCLHHYTTRPKWSTVNNPYTGQLHTVHNFLEKQCAHGCTAVKLTCTSVNIAATHSKGNTMHSSVDVRQTILLPSSRSATTQTPSTGDSGLQQQR